jgi:peroxin-4
MKELDTWNNTESAGEQGIERLGPVSDDELLTWESVINGRGVGCGYESAFSLFFSSLPLHNNPAPPSHGQTPS